MPEPSENHDVDPTAATQAMSESTLSSDTVRPTRPAVNPQPSQVRVLPSSLPVYHHQYVEEARRGRNGGVGRGMANLNLNPNARTGNLLPSSQSSLVLADINSRYETHPDEPVTAEKKKQPRWQFGIRSRNNPHEAMHCVYRALEAHGAEWECEEPRPKNPKVQPKTFPVNVEGMIHDYSQDDTSSSPSSSPHSSAKSAKSAKPAPKPKKEKRMVPKPDGDGYETADSDIDMDVLPWNYLPKEPWCIKARWRKDGMIPLSQQHHSLSASSSRINLAESERPVSTGSTNSTAKPNVVASSSTTPSAETSCYVHMEIQLYAIDPATTTSGHRVFLVDFKCAGYENLVDVMRDDVGKRAIAAGHRLRDKEVTSPYPFMDLANKLVIHLAAGPP